MLRRMSRAACNHRRVGNPPLHHRTIHFIRISLPKAQELTSEALVSSAPSSFHDGVGLSSYPIEQNELVEWPEPSFARSRRGESAGRARGERGESAGRARGVPRNQCATQSLRNKSPAPTTPRSADCNLLKILPILPDHSARWYQMVPRTPARHGVAAPRRRKGSEKGARGSTASFTNP